GVGRVPEGARGGVRADLLAGLFAEPESDRAAVEVPTQARPSAVARELRSDAGGGGEGVESPGRLSGGIDRVDDGTLPSGAREAGRSSAGVGQLTPREMPQPPSQIESEGQADHAGLAIAPIC